MTHICQECSIPFEAKRSDARFHNDACRVRNARKRRGAAKLSTDAEKLISSVHSIMIKVAITYEEAAINLRKLYTESLA
jgi:hypothetical protein